MNPELLKILNDHDWTGNIRELKNTVESMLTMSNSSVAIEPEHVHLEEKKTASKEPFLRDHGDGKKLEDVVSSTDEEMVRIVLQKTNWNKTHAAKALGISRASLNRRIEKYDIDKRTY